MGVLSVGSLKTPTSFLMHSRGKCIKEVWLNYFKILHPEIPALRISAAIRQSRDDDPKNSMARHQKTLFVCVCVCGLWVNKLFKTHVVV